MTPQLTGQYVQHFFKVDEWVNRSICRAGAITGSDDIITDVELRRTEFYNDFLKKLGIFYVMGTILPLGEGANIGIIGIHRARRAGLFEEEEKRNLRFIVPHLRRALQVQAVLSGAEARKQITFDILERLSLGVLVVKSNCEIVFLNTVADRLLKAGKGIACAQGKLRLRGHDRTSALDAMVRQASLLVAAPTRCLEDSFALLQHSSGNALTVLLEDGRAVSLLVCPLPQQYSVVPVGSALIFVEDPDAKRIPPSDMLAQLYGLSPAETRLVLALLEGTRLQDFADERGVSLATAKTQLRQVFQKTRTDRQSELIRQIVGNPIFRMGAGRVENEKTVGRSVR